MITYRDRLTEAMDLCSAQGIIILGQAIAYPGTGMTETFRNVPKDQLIELPVFENTQMGMCTGLSIVTQQPVLSVYPRINFLLCAIDQLVLHLDAIPRYSDYRPRVLIRIAVATDHPLDPGAQHLGDYTIPLKGMLQSVQVERLNHAGKILPAYRNALARMCSTLLVEYVDLYETT